MQNRIYKYLRLTCLCLLSSSGIQSTYAQDNQAKYISYLQVFKKKITDADVSYKYSFALFSESSRSDMMEVKGVFYKAGKSYLDSSSQSISLLSGDYFFRLRSKERDAYVYSIRSMEKNMGVKAFGSMNQVMAIPDSMLLKDGKFTSTDEGGGVITLRYLYSGKNNMLQEMNMKIRNADTALLEMKIVIKDNSGYRKKVVLSDFKSFDNKIINASRYFRVSGKQVTLTNRFRSFKVNALL